MANYAPSTRARIADLNVGIRVETGTYPCVTHHHINQQEVFNVFGRIQITHLFCEFITDNAGAASGFVFNYTITAPAAVGPFAMGVISADAAALVAGSRIVMVGGAVGVGTHSLVVATGGYSSLATTTTILGGLDHESTIGILTDGEATGGTAKCVLIYVPMSDGAYVTGNVLPV